jgi:hypothetical protein
MKTPEEIYEECRPRHRDWGTLKGMCIEAMKIYAKQWIDKAYKNTFMPQAIADQLKKEIDEQ